MQRSQDANGIPPVELLKAQSAGIVVVDLMYS